MELLHRIFVLNTKNNRGWDGDGLAAVTGIVVLPVKQR